MCPMFPVATAENMTHPVRKPSSGGARDPRPARPIRLPAHRLLQLQHDPRRRIRAIPARSERLRREKETAEQKWQAVHGKRGNLGLFGVFRVEVFGGNLPSCFAFFLFFLWGRNLSEGPVTLLQSWVLVLSKAGLCFQGLCQLSLSHASQISVSCTMSLYFIFKKQKGTSKSWYLVSLFS